jgi:hypothetical protein
MTYGKSHLFNILHSLTLTELFFSELVGFQKINFTKFKNILRFFLSFLYKQSLK